jgi:hypothetical protein
MRDAAVHGARGVRAMTEGLRQTAQRTQGGPWRRSDARGGYRGPRLTALAPEPPGAPGVEAPGGPRPLESATARYSARRGRMGPPSVLSLIDSLAGSLAELIARSGDLAYEVATAIAEQGGPTAAGGDGDGAALAAAGAAGEQASIGMALWNTSDTPLRNVSFAATDLLGPEKPIKTSAVKFDPPTIATLAAGAGVEVTVLVKIPANAPAGTYRGLIGVERLDPYAVLELVVGGGTTPVRAASSARWAEA